MLLPFDERFSWLSFTLHNFSGGTSMLVARSTLDSDIAVGLLSILIDVITNFEVEEGIEVICAIIYLL